ncbi:MAG: hypothetical protein JNL23_03555 [Chitinophagaceae bacterium]|nr:hypothetical protein [Chitinophagaceae bacterium]
MDKKANLKSLIELYENAQLDFKQVQLSVNEITGKTISEEEIKDYWTYTSLDNFCEMLLIEPITDWQDIDDAKALLLIEEVLDNVTNDALLTRNSEALEKRYRKPSGFLNDLVFHSDINSPNEILKQLKKDKTINL